MKWHGKIYALVLSIPYGFQKVLLPFPALEVIAVADQRDFVGIPLNLVCGHRDLFVVNSSNRITTPCY